MEACPICSTRVPLHELEGHVQLHFLDDEPINDPAALPASTAAAADSKGLTGSDEFLEEEVDGLVYCPYGCGARIALHELDSHEEAHR